MVVGKISLGHAWSRDRLVQSSPGIVHRAVLHPRVGEHPLPHHLPLPMVLMVLVTSCSTSNILTSVLLLVALAGALTGTPHPPPSGSPPLSSSSTTCLAIWTMVTSPTPTSSTWGRRGALCPRLDGQGGTGGGEAGLNRLLLNSHLNPLFSIIFIIVMRSSIISMRSHKHLKYKDAPVKYYFVDFFCKRGGGEYPPIQHTGIFGQKDKHQNFVLPVLPRASSELTLGYQRAGRSPTLKYENC